MSAFERKLKKIKELLREPVVMVPVPSMDLGLKLMSGRMKLEKLHEETLEIIEEMEEQIKALHVNNTGSKIRLPEPPCQIGDVLWVVYEETNEVICVGKMICKDLLYDGGVWMVGEGEGVYDEVDKEVVWTSIERACKEVERRLEEYRNDG